jgi:transposase-like protein
VQKADLQPANDASPDQTTLNEIVIRISGQQLWLYAAVNPETNEFLHLRLFATTTITLHSGFFTNFVRNMMLKTPSFSSITHSILRLCSADLGSDFRRFVWKSKQRRTYL